MMPDIAGVGTGFQAGVLKLRNFSWPGSHNRFDLLFLASGRVEDGWVLG